MDSCDQQWFQGLCVGETLVPSETTGDTAEGDISVSHSAVTGTSRIQRVLLRPTTQTPGRTRLWGPCEFSGSKGASANSGLLLVSGLQPEDEADSDRAGWCNRAPHSDTVSFAEISENEQEAFLDTPPAESVDHPSGQIVPQGENSAPEGAEQRA
ncbi:hypothetical protein CapIbe_014744 [Capra ibex]